MPPGFETLDPSLAEAWRLLWTILAEPVLQFFLLIQLTVTIPQFSQEIGAATPQKVWQVPAAGGKTAERARCEFSGGALSGLVAVVSQGAGPLYVVAADYVAKDPGWRAILEGP